jgi:hypothetical protein
MALGVEQREGDAPGAADNDPAVDSEVFAQPLDVPDQVCRRVRRQIGIPVAGQGPAAPAPALVEQHSPVGAGIEIAARFGAASASGATVEVDRCGSVARSAHLPVQAVSVCHGQHAGPVGLHRRVTLSHQGRVTLSHQDSLVR